MAFLTDLNKIYNQNHIANIVIIFSVCFGYIFLAPSQGCPENWDCNSYIKMVDSIAYNSSIVPHHAMRIFPALIVKFLVSILGFSTENGFKFLSGLSYLSFSLGFYFVLTQISRSDKNPASKIYILALTLLTMASHHAVIQSLVNVYQSSDALTYPIILFMFYFTYFKKQYHWVFLLTLLGIITRQNLFFMGELCLIFGLITQKRFINLIFILLAGLSYTLLVNYYQANSMLLSTITPSDNFFTISSILYILQDSGVLSLIIPILPITIFVLKDLIWFYIKNWYLLLYTAITVGQPFLAYHLTGNNFGRIAMQGIWPIYLISGLLFYEKYLKDKNSNLVEMALLFYAGCLLFIMQFSPVIAEPLRIILSMLLLLLLSIKFISIIQISYISFYKRE